jgi:hypothetical protein
MKLDPVLAEIRRTREAYAARFSGDTKAMLADLRKRQAESGRPSVARAPRRLSDDDIRETRITQ